MMLCKLWKFLHPVLKQIYRGHHVNVKWFYTILQVFFIGFYRRGNHWPVKDRESHFKKTPYSIIKEANTNGDTVTQYHIDRDLLQIDLYYKKEKKRAMWRFRSKWVFKSSRAVLEPFSWSFVIEMNVSDPNASCILILLQSKSVVKL